MTVYPSQRLAYSQVQMRYCCISVSALWQEFEALLSNSEKAPRLADGLETGGVENQASGQCPHDSSHHPRQSTAWSLWSSVPYTEHESTHPPLTCRQSYCQILNLREFLASCPYSSQLYLSHSRFPVHFLISISPGSQKAPPEVSPTERLASCLLCQTSTVGTARPPQSFHSLHCSSISAL